MPASLCIPIMSARGLITRMPASVATIKSPSANFNIKLPAGNFIFKSTIRCLNPDAKSDSLRRQANYERDGRYTDMSRSETSTEPDRSHGTSSPLIHSLLSSLHVGSHDSITTSTQSLPGELPTISSPDRIGPTDLARNTEFRDPLFPNFLAPPFLARFHTSNGLQNSRLGRKPLLRHPLGMDTFTHIRPFTLQIH